MSNVLYKCCNGNDIMWPRQRIQQSPLKIHFSRHTKRHTILWSLPATKYKLRNKFVRVNTKFMMIWFWRDSDFFKKCTFTFVHSVLLLCAFPLKWKSGGSHFCHIWVSLLKWERTGISDLMCSLCKKHPWKKRIEIYWLVLVISLSLCSLKHTDDSVTTGNRYWSRRESRHRKNSTLKMK